MYSEIRLMSKLPKELLYKIFDYLDHSLLYCKYLLPKDILPNKYKTIYINSIKKKPRYYICECSNIHRATMTFLDLGFLYKKMSFLN